MSAETIGISRNEHNNLVLSIQLIDCLSPYALQAGGVDSKTKAMRGR